MAYSTSRLTLYAVISAIESDLRRALLFHLGSEGTPRSILGDELYGRTLERYCKEHDNPNPNLEELVPYIDFSDTYQTLNSHASKIPKPVAQVLSRASSRFERIAGVRNRVAHGRPLLFDDFARTLDSAEEFIGNGVLPWESLRATLSRLKSEPSFVLSLNIPDYAGSSKHNLPVPDFDETGFIGRREEVEEVKKLCLGPYPVVTIVGEGGLGKTALALKVAYDLLDSPACPFESVVWSSSKANLLTGQEIVEIQNAISDSLGLLTNVAYKLAGAAAGDAIEEVLEYLKQFRILLVLDNLETVIDARLRKFLQQLPTGSKLLITSRIGLGAYEVPFKLEPLPQSDSVHLLRALAKTRHITYLEKLSSARLAKYCEKMHQSPGFIKWFVSAVQAGRRPEEVLARPDIFLDFCLSNVYKYLSDLSKKVLRCMLCVPTPNSQAELSFLTGLDFLELQTAIQQLLTTNMIVMSSIPSGSSFESRYTLSDLPREYLLRHHPVDKEEYSSFVKRRQQMISQGEKTLADARTNPLGHSSISIRSRSDLIVARYLIDAIAESERGNNERALTAISKAKALAPEYYEVWRVEGFVHEREQNFPAALEAYRAAVELEPKSIKVRHALGRFLLLVLGEHDAAIEQFNAALVLDPTCAEVQLDLVRVYLYSMRFDEGRLLLDGLLPRVGTLRREQCSKTYDLHLQYFTRLAEFHRFIKHDLAAALDDYEQLYAAFQEIPPALVDVHMKKHLGKALPSACRCERDLHEQDKKTIQPIITWLSQFRISEPQKGAGDKRLRGKIARVFKLKKFGFIALENGSELFFHQKSLTRARDWNDISEGVEVEFELGSNKQGECAVHLRVVDKVLEAAVSTGIS